MQEVCQGKIVALGWWIVARQGKIVAQRGWIVAG